MKTIQLKISGMTCASCVHHIEGDLKALDGVEEATVNLPLNSGRVLFDSAKLGEKEIIAAVKGAGYKAVVDEGEHHGGSHGGGAHGSHDRGAADGTPEDDGGHEHTGGGYGPKLVVAAILSAAVVLLLFLLPEVPSRMIIVAALSFVLLAYSGSGFFLKGIPDLFKGRPAMDTLVALGVGAAFAYSTFLVIDSYVAGEAVMEEYFMDVVIITTFILLGRFLEERARARAGNAIRKLLELSAKIAHRIGKNGVVEDIPADQIELHDLLRIKPGEKIPTDGVIVEGIATIDESMVTGESIPVDKNTGALVIGATINGATTFTMKATKIGSETVLSQIIKLVQEAQMHKAPIQKLVDLVAGYFVWGVIAIATITFAGWWYVSGGVGAENILSLALVPTVAVLIIACPCALGLATPISIVVGSGKGAQLGILIKKTESLEKTHKITAIAFDKTGTITEGKPKVQEYKVMQGEDQEVMNLALALEEQSEHPLAQGVIAFIQKHHMGAKAPKVTHFKAIAGRGVEGTINGAKYVFGSSAFMRETGVLHDEGEREIVRMESQGYTVLSLADEKKILALFGVMDGIKSTSREAIKRLRERGVKTVMLTGDNETVARRIAQDVGIEEVHAGVTPDKKAEIVKNLQSEGHFVAMAGDGINDSIAIAKADVGFAMGTGTDVAIETGDIVLVRGDLHKVVEAIDLSNATLRNIKQNLFWAFIYNSVGIPLAALGFLNPAFSAGAMAFSSVSVVLNALRLKRFTPR